MVLKILWQYTTVTKTFKGLTQGEVNKAITYLSELQDMYGSTPVLVTVK